MSEKLNKLTLLLWKNWILLKANSGMIVTNFLCTSIIFVLLIVIRIFLNPTKHDAIYFPPFDVSKVMMDYSNYTLVYSPFNTHLKEIVINTLNTLKMNPSMKGTVFKNSNQMELYFRDDEVFKDVLAGIQFDDSLGGNSDLPKNITVALRFPGSLRSKEDEEAITLWVTDRLFPRLSMPGPRSHQSKTAPPGYYEEGFLAIQKTLTFHIIKHLNNSFNEPALLMARYPYPKWTADPFINSMKTLFYIFISCSFMSIYSCLIEILAKEKEKQLKETMKIMGLSNFLYWTAWLIALFTVFLIIVIFMVIILKVPFKSGFGILTHTNPFVIFLFLFIYIWSMILFIFAISVFFTKASTIQMVIYLYFLLDLILTQYVLINYNNSNLSKLLLCLLCDIGLQVGLCLMFIFESTGEGLQLSSINKTVTPDDDLTMLHIMIMLIINSIVYILIIFYVEAVFPGEYGVSRVWYFPCTLSYWRGQHTSADMGNNNESSLNQDPNIYEKEPDNLKIGIQIIHLNKTFSNKQVAVKDLSFNMFKGQITVLLGENGAGKTTTMLMLIGMFSPTSGTAIVRGYDIRTQLDKVRKSLGICPQHNILFDEMTVEEHIYFYCKLKCLKASEIQNEINKYIGMLELDQKRNLKPAALSGGMQRKLSVILALCGNSKVVILDEPTSGMDPVARRGLWDLLISEKEGRTILLTTHFMDEAEILGDRIAILAHGKLQCCGSSFFLKKKYGTGYRLTMDVSSECDPEKVTKLLSNRVPDVKMESIFGSELIYAIRENHVPVFKKMFRDLEENSEGLGIKSFGISLATLEEVFLKVGTDHKPKKNEKELNKDRENNNRDIHINQESSNVEISDSSLVKGCTLRSNQILAMLLKKDLIFLRHWVLFLVQLLTAILFICLSMSLGSSSRNSYDEQKELKFDLEPYRSSVTVISGKNLYKTGYIQSLDDLNHEYYLTSNVSDYIFNLTKKSAQTVRSRYIIGATFHEDNSILAWFNNEPYHSSPLALKMAMNTIIRTALGQYASIEITNYPLPLALPQKGIMMPQSLGMRLASNTGWIMCIILGIYILYYVRERVIKFKLLQFLSGIEACTFWIVTFLWDLLTYMIIAVCIILIIYAFQEDGYKTPQQIGSHYSFILGVLFVIFLYSGFGVLPMIYLFSLIFKTDVYGFLAIFSINLFLGLYAFTALKMMKFLNSESANIAHEVFLVLPPYSFCSGIDSSYDAYVINKMCESIVDDCLSSGDHVIDECRNIICRVQEKCCEIGNNYYKWNAPGILKNIVYSVGVGIFCLTLLLLIDKNFFDCLLYNAKTKSITNYQETQNDDNDVLDEKLKVRRMSGRELGRYVLVLKNVTKYYKKITAVNNLCVSVQSKECFGLLGINGAGKTTTFKMMIGEIRMSQGDIWIGNNNLKQNRNKVQKCIGYCPQFDALLDELTGNETMMIFCLIRGIQRKECDYTIDRLSKALDFHKYLHKKVKNYSGGNKRKLNTAIAMIGEPSIIFLDEPTTGMDPGAKRKVWDEISRIRENGKCVILTSHSMEECEALCTRLAIMVNGEFKCIGSRQHLKSKFSEGYILMVKIHKLVDAAAYDKQVDIIEKFVKKNFPNAVVREKYQEMITYHIPNKNKSWSEMFEIMENNKSVLNLEDYSLSQPNLEQIFISVTKSQENQ